MKTIIVGMGVQGKKRKKFLGKDFIYSVDKFKKSDFNNIETVPLEDYNAVLICLPDNQKYKVINYCIKNKKHVLVEKPLILKNLKYFSKLQKKARANNVVCYTAYNHRFEPHVIKMKKLINSKKLGKIYSCRIFYGNGTARLVKNNWRDEGKGILNDLTPHLLDICRFWFKNYTDDFKLVASNNFENKAPDHAYVITKKKIPTICFEISFLMWKNSFKCDVIGSKGSAHIDNLCKWGKSTFVYRKRKFPSGRPSEKRQSILKLDPTWYLEYKHFKNLIKKNKKTNLSNDAWIQKQLQII